MKKYFTAKFLGYMQTKQRPIESHVFMKNIVLEMTLYIYLLDNKAYCRLIAKHKCKKPHVSNLTIYIFMYFYIKNHLRQRINDHNYKNPYENIGLEYTSIEFLEWYVLLKTKRKWPCSIYQMLGFHLRILN